MFEKVDIYILHSQRTRFSQRFSRTLLSSHLNTEWIFIGSPSTSRQKTLEKGLREAQNQRPQPHSTPAPGQLSHLTTLGLRKSGSPALGSLATDVNPLTPRRTLVSPFTEISILFYEGIIKKISYERRGYESVDEKSLS